MEKRNHSFYINLWVGATFGVLAFLLSDGQGFALTRRITDALFVAATVLLGCGGLRFCGNHGAFNTLGYGVKHLATTFLPWAFNPKSDFGKKESYLEYTQRKEKNRKSPNAMLLAGSVYLGLSLVAMAVHYFLA